MGERRADAHDTLTWAAGSRGATGASERGAAATAGSSSGSSRISATRTSSCVAPQVIHDDYFWDGYWTGGAFQLALTLGAGGAVDERDER